MTVDNWSTYEQRMTANYNGLHPINVKGVSNLNNIYQCRYLWNKIYSKFKFDFGGLEWDLNTFRMLLFKFGSLGIFKSDGGWVFAPWTVETLNIYLNPKTIKGYKLFYTTYFNELGGTVNKDAFIVKCFDDYLGWGDLVESTGEVLANIDKSINIALMNANVNLVGYADGKTDAEEIKLAYAQATDGEPLVVVNKNKILDGRKDHILEPFTNHDTVGIIDKLLVARRTVINNFLTEIGINNANLTKKERLITDEVNANNEELSANISIVYENIKKAFDIFNKETGNNITVELVETDDTTVVDDNNGGGNDV